MYERVAQLLGVQDLISARQLTQRDFREIAVLGRPALRVGGCEVVVAAEAPLGALRWLREDLRPGILQGPQAATAFAVVAANGTIIYARGVPTVIPEPSATGGDAYEIGFADDVSQCAIAVTPVVPDGAGNFTIAARC